MSLNIFRNWPWFALLALMGCASGNDSSSESVGSDREEVRLGTPVTSPSTIRERAVVRINQGGCTGTLVRPNWVLTGVHCVRSNPAINESVTVTHDPTGLSEVVSNTDFFLPSDVSMDVALLRLNTPIDIDPVDPNPTVVPFFAGADSELVGAFVTAYGYGLRDLKPLSHCSSDGQCVGTSDRCDPDSEEGEGQCYSSLNESEPPSGSCSHKTHCPPGQDCNELLQKCYAPTGFVARGSNRCTSNFACSGNRLCDRNRCASPVSCLTKVDCPAGFECDPEGNSCYMPSVHRTAAQCDMSAVCTENVDCAGGTLCVDGRCCNQIGDLRSGTLPVTKVIYHEQFQAGAAPWNGKLLEIPLNPANGQQILPGDSGGPHFFGSELVAVTMNGVTQTHVRALRPWAKGVMVPVTGGRLSPGSSPSLVAFGTTSSITVGGDFNGDGHADLVVLPPNASGSERAEHVAPGRFFGHGPVEVWGSLRLRIERAVAADFNGDGRDDLVSFGAPSAAVFVQLSTGTSFAAPITVQPADFTVPGDRLRIGDLNGDKYADLVNFKANNDVTVAFGCGPGLGFDSPDPIAGCSGLINRFGAPQSWQSDFALTSHEVLTGDFNGDGYDDILGSSPGGASWVALTSRKACTVDTDCTDNVCYSDLGVCRAALGRAPSNVGDWGTGHVSDIKQAADINGDGMDDLVLITQSTGSVRVARALGASEIFAASTPWGANLCTGTTLCIPGDIDDDGREDIAKVHLDGSRNVFVAFSR